MKEFKVNLPAEPDISLRVTHYPCRYSPDDAMTVIIIPGFFGSIEERAILAGHLMKCYNVVIYEPRGFGKSSKKHQKGIYRVEHFAWELGELLEYLGLEDNRFILLGSSLSVAFIHQYVMYRNGPRPAALVFISPAPRYRGWQVLRAVGPAPNWLVGLVRKMIFFILRTTRNSEEAKNLDYAEKRFIALDQWVQFRIAVEAVGYADMRGLEGDIREPVCVFSARKDGFTSPEQARKYVQGDRSQLVMVDSDAHKFINGREAFIVEKINRFMVDQGIWDSECVYRTGYGHKA